MATATEKAVGMGKAMGMEKVTAVAAAVAAAVEVEGVVAVAVAVGMVTGAVVAVIVTMAAVIRRRRLRAMAGGSLRRPTMVARQGKISTKLKVHLKLR